MKVTNADIWNAKEALAELIKEPWSPKTSYWITKLARKVSEELRDIERVRNDLLMRYGTKDENGQVWIKPESPNWGTFAPEYDELMAEEVEIPIDRIVLPDCENLPIERQPRVKPAALMALEPFMEMAE